MSRITFETLIEAGAHFGHLKRKWNPAMAPYIFMERNGIHIIDLHKTAAMTETAAEALKQIAKGGKKILFVSTKKQLKEIVAEKAQSVGMPYVIERWPGGMLTNFPTIRKAVKKMATISLSCFFVETNKIFLPPFAICFKASAAVSVIAAVLCKSMMWIPLRSMKI